eukprot:GHRR01009380.1.p1 GENE.GHRR01009380.1~~GHRR01009380.1.p1  ORF type:complete len:1159 (+),score=411.60 GHRR01009380.1:174-3479(+)
MAKAGTIRGLQVFISDIRACQNKEQETRRVDKELAKIRGKFGDEKKTLTAYDRKKYIWKLLYIYMLGYDVEFGHKQACDLIPAQKYSEKQVGYMACSLLINEKDEFLRLAINGIHNDLISRNEAFQSLALTFVANIAGQEMAEALTPDVLKLLTSGTARPVVRKKAALCLLRLMRKTPADAQLVSADSFSPIMAQLLEERDLGLLLSCATLLLGICARSGSAGYEQCQFKLVRLLERLVALRDITPDYTYYGIASPWLQAKVLRTLQYFPPPEGTALQRQLHDVLQAICTTCGDTAKSSTINKSNAQHAILFEAISLILALDLNRDLLATGVTNMGRFLSVKEPNIRYLALENLTRLALVPEVLESIRSHQSTILANLKDPDVSIRRRALDLLFTMCDDGAAMEVVEELVTYLIIADFSMREELVLKIAILAEKFAPDVQWYVDVVLALLERAGDFCSEDIWHRVVQLVTNNEGSQAYAANRVVEVLGRGSSHEALMCLAAYVLGEYGKLIKPKVPTLEQFKLLHERFPTLNTSTKGLLLTAYLKMLLADPDNTALQNEVTSVFSRYAAQLDPELQQRSAEYLVLAQDPANAALRYVLPMPKWEGRESALLKRLAATEGNDADADGAPPSAAAAADEALSPSPNKVSLALGGVTGIATRPAATTPPPQAVPSTHTPAAVAATTAAALAARKAPDFDLLGGDELPYTNGVATPAAARAAAPPKAVDLLDELFMPSATQPALSQLAAASSTSSALPHAGGLAMQGSIGPPVQPHQQQQPSAAAAAAPWPGSYSIGNLGTYGSIGMQAAPQGSMGSVGFTSVGSWGPSGLNPAGSVGSTASMPFAAGGYPARTASVTGPADVSMAEFGSKQAGAGAYLGFDDAAFGPVDDWRVLGDVQQWHKALLTKEKGIFYEDTLLQIGLQSRYTRSKGELLLFLGNKQTAQPLENLALLLSDPSPAIQVVMGQLPAQLAPKQQVQVSLQVTCMQPFLEPPRLQLRYATGSRQVVQELALPLAPHKFMVPEPQIGKEAFFERWKSYHGPPLKLQQMVERGQPLGIDATLLLLRGLNFGVEHLYLDPSPNNEAGAAYFVCGQPGAEQALLCQV